jgi:hypothetical protein
MPVTTLASLSPLPSPIFLYDIIIAQHKKPLAHWDRRLSFSLVAQSIMNHSINYEESRVIGREVDRNEKQGILDR